MSMLNTPDPQGAKAFYGTLFGSDADTMEFGADQITMWRLPGFAGGEPGQPVPADVVGVMLPTGGDQPPYWSVDFWVADADAAADKAAALGGRSLARFDTPTGRTAVLVDPQGAAFSVSTVPTAS